MAPDSPVLSADDRALLDRLAARIVELRLETPAILTLESARPLTVVAGQAMLFFEPFVQALFRLPEYRRFAALIERRDVMEVFARTIEDRAEEARRARRGPPKTPAGAP